MSTAPTLDGVLDAVRPLIEAGASLHWLVPRDKMPIAKDWSSKPVYTTDQLRASYRTGANIGLRTGEPSKVDGLYLHVLDLDIRVASTAPAAWVALLRLLPSARTLPSVISGSGGESRHIYFLTASPLRSKTLVKSDGFEMVPDPKKGRDVKKFDWQIEIKGSGTQVAIPPSIHPSGLPYRWERPLDLDFPMLLEVNTASWNVATVHKTDFDDDDLEVIMRQEPLDIDEDRVMEILAALPENWYDERQLWLDVGMALHHQFRGSDKGFNIWCDWSEQSPKYDEKNSVVVWLSFKGNPNPKTFKTLIQQENEVKSAAEAERFKHDLDLDDFSPPAIRSTDLSDLLGDTPSTAKAVTIDPLDTVAPFDPDWMQLLHRNEEGELKSTLHNVALMSANDLRIRESLWFNDFREVKVMRKPPRQASKKREKGKPVVNLTGPQWQVRDPVNGDSLTDTHYADFRRIIEAPTTQGGYGMKVSDRDIYAAFDINSRQRSFHPVRERLLSTVWDRTPRAATLFIDYLGCEDTAYHRNAAVLFLLGAVARVFQPGHKFDFVPILEGAQGQGKSTFIRILGLDWFRELAGDISKPQEAVSMLSGAWILEIGELSAMQRSEVNDLKAFISRQVDVARMPYERTAREFPRQCVFMGSTNDSEYLRDATGGRRFWPIKCRNEGMIDNPRLRREVMQIWAEAVHMYMQQMDGQTVRDLPLHMTDKAALIEAQAMQESRRVETTEEMLAGKIEVWLNTPLGAEFDDLDVDSPKVLRQETCVQQIWEEMMGREGSIPHTEAMKIGKAMIQVAWPRTSGPIISLPINKKYGKCRVYTRPEI